MPANADDVMELEVAYVLDAVAETDCIFIRNGKEHEPGATKDHLKLKRRKGLTRSWLSIVAVN